MRFIAIEGPDRVGKATQAKMLRDWLIDHGQSATVVEVPIAGNFTYRLIYWMLRNGLAKKLPKIFQGLQCLNRWIFQTFDLVKLGHRYDYVIFDRWSPSTVVYGMAEGLSRESVEKMYVVLYRPDITFVLLGDAHKHEAEDVYEADSELQSKVRKRYKEWAAEKPRERRVIDCSQSKEQISKEILHKLTDAGLLKIESQRFW